MLIIMVEQGFYAVANQVGSGHVAGHQQQVALADDLSRCQALALFFCPEHVRDQILSQIRDSVSCFDLVPLKGEARFINLLALHLMRLKSKWHQLWHCHNSELDLG